MGEGGGDDSIGRLGRKKFRTFAHLLRKKDGWDKRTRPAKRGGKEAGRGGGVKN